MTLKKLVILCSLIQLCSFLFQPACTLRARPQGQITACKSNLKNLATALEMYGDDHDAFPTNLDLLTPNYLRTLPTCPAAASVTYHNGYLAGADQFLVACYGQHHQNVEITEPHYPRYHSVNGLSERP